METIREDCFETNSSSNHTLSIKNKKDFNFDIKPSDDGYIYCSFGEFGWEIENYNDAGTKLTYALTMVAETEPYSSEEEFYNTEGFNIINNCIKEELHCKGIIIEDPGFEVIEYKAYNGKHKFYLKFNGYIDHQSSSDDYKSLRDFLDDWGIDIKRFIFDLNVVLHTDNDNH